MDQKSGYPVDIYYKRHVIKCSVFATQFKKYVLYILCCVFVTPFLQPAYNFHVSNLLCCRVSITRDLSRHWTLKVWFGKQLHFARHPQKNKKNNILVLSVLFLDSLAKRRLLVQGEYRNHIVWKVIVYLYGDDSSPIGFGGVGTRFFLNFLDVEQSCFAPATEYIYIFSEEPSADAMCFKTHRRRKDGTHAKTPTASDTKT